MRDFSATYDLNLDAKNRLTVPSKYRPDFADGLVFSKHMSEPCLTIWREEDYGAWVSSALEGKNQMLPAVQKLMRFFHSNRFALELDGAGRVIVPPKLLQKVGLGKEVTLVGVGTNFELWDRTAWSEVDDDLPGEVPELIEQVNNL